MAQELLTVTQYEALGYDRLMKRIRSQLREAERMGRMVNKAKQVQVLPAITALKNLTAQPGRRITKEGFPTFEESLLLLELNPATVRGWKFRTAAEMDIASLLGEEKKAPVKRSPSSTTEHRRLITIARLLRNGNIDKALELAERILEENEE
jgi:hypothetical protein